MEYRGREEEGRKGGREAAGQWHKIDTEEKE